MALGLQGLWVVVALGFKLQGSWFRVWGFRV